MNRFFIGINCYPKNNKYKFKRLLLSLLMHPKESLNYRTDCYNTPVIVSMLNNVPDISFSNMVEWILKGDCFTISTVDICVEFLIDGFEDSQDLLSIIEEFKKFHPNVIISGTKKHTSLTINRNIFLKNHKTDYVCFCDDDDISCSIDTKYELFIFYVNYIFQKIQDTNNVINQVFKLNYSVKDRTKMTLEEIIDSVDSFRKTTYDLIRSKVIQETIFKNDFITINKYSTKLPTELLSMNYTRNFYGPHFFTTYDSKSNSYGICYGFWSLIIPPFMIDNFTNVKEVKNEDVAYDITHQLIRQKKCLSILFTKPIYYYLTSSYTSYSVNSSNDAIMSLGNAMMFGSTHKFKFPDSVFEYDTIVEYLRNDKEVLTFVSDRDFRSFSIDDVKKYITSFSEELWYQVWNEKIKEFSKMM